MTETNPKDAIGSLKAPMSVVPMQVIAEVGVALLEGALKYGRFNYRKSAIKASVYFDATQRHLNAWYEGEDLDPDSELSHITKAIASLTVFRDAMLNGKVIDDRPPRVKSFYAGLNVLTAKLFEKYGDRNPKHYTIADSGSDGGYLLGPNARRLYSELKKTMLTRDSET